jgi:hypothetical protein
MNIRPNTKDLLDCIALDIMPGLATCVDFGIDLGDVQRKYGALQWAVRHGMVDEIELDQAMGDGEKLTEIVNRGENPYKVVIKTAWDNLNDDD